MFKIYDNVNKYLYAQGETVEQLIDDWNEGAGYSLLWILEQENNEDFYNKATEKCYRIENLMDVCRLINSVEVNGLTLYKGNDIISWEDIG